MTNMGDLYYFLGMAIQHDLSGMFLSQTKYVIEIIERVGMSSCKPVSTLVDTSLKLAALIPVDDPTAHLRLAILFWQITLQIDVHTS